MKDALGDVQSVLVLGGTSDIGLAIARRLAAPRRASVVLAGRDQERLEAAATTLGTDGGGGGIGAIGRGSGADTAAADGGVGRDSGAGGGAGTAAADGAVGRDSGAGGGADTATADGAVGRDSGAGGGAGGGRVVTVAFDALDTAGHDRVMAEAAALVGDLDVVVVAFGVLGNQDVDEAGGDGAVQLAAVNYVGAVSVCLAAARRLRAQGHGTLVVLSSVAGERVRKTNFIYGSSKAGIDGFAQGLGDSLHGSGVRVLIVRPGFVVSKMTTGLTPPPLSTTPDAVAQATAHALRDGRGIVWVPATLRPVMAATRHLPRALFRRLRF